MLAKHFLAFFNASVFSSFEQLITTLFSFIWFDFHCTLLSHLLSNGKCYFDAAMSETDTQQQPPQGCLSFHDIPSSSSSFLIFIFPFSSNVSTFNLNKCDQLNCCMWKFSVFRNYFWWLNLTGKTKEKGKRKGKRKNDSETASAPNTDENSSSPPPPRLQTPNSVVQSIELHDSLSGKQKTSSKSKSSSGKKKKENTVFFPIL